MDILGCDEFIITQVLSEEQSRCEGSPEFIIRSSAVRPVEEFLDEGRVWSESNFGIYGLCGRFIRARGTKVCGF